MLTVVGKGIILFSSIKLVLFIVYTFSVTNFNNRNMRPDNDGIYNVLTYFILLQEYMNIL